jgi:hypothetical protein
VVVRALKTAAAVFRKPSNTFQHFARPIGQAIQQYNIEKSMRTKGVPRKPINIDLFLGSKINMHLFMALDFLRGRVPPVPYARMLLIYSIHLYIHLVILDKEIF